MNEGCGGGWAFFNGYFAENAYMVKDQCMPYKAKTKGLTCGMAQNCSAYAKLERSYFVGGAYGEVSEESMMKELVRNGPINGELQVPKAFSLYSTGIMSNDHETKMQSYLEYSGAATEHKESQQLIETSSLTDDEVKNKD